MSLATTTFRWLEILESQFDRAYIELDNLLMDPEVPELEDVVGPAREKMAILCSAFVQLTEKAQTISFQTNAKLEAQVCSLRQDLVESQSEKDFIQQDYRNLLFEFHKAQLEKVQDDADGGQSKTILRSLLTGQDDATSSAVTLEEARLTREVVQLKKENLQLRELVVALQSEMYGAHLATRYLDKELAGRIQQIQLLSRGGRAQDHSRLWNHLEAEISLQRHKTIVQACQTRNRRKRGTDRKKRQAESLSPVTTPTPAMHSLPKLDGQTVSGVVRHVEIYKEPGQQVGLSVTGGHDHGVPILISEIREGQLAETSGKFLVGDAILSVNGLDLQQTNHQQAVQILSSLEGNILFELLYVQPESDDDDENASLNDQFSIGSEENCATTDSLRALGSGHSQSNSSLSRFSQVTRRPRFPGRAVLAAPAAGENGSGDLSAKPPGPAGLLGR